MLLKEKLKSPYNKFKVCFWIIYWILTIWFFLKNSKTVLAVTEDENGLIMELVFAGVLLSIVLSIVFCVYKFANTYRLKNPEGREYKPRIKWYHFLPFIAVDVFAFYCMELINNSEKLIEMSLLYVSMNLLGGLIMLLMLFLLLNSVRRTCAAFVAFSTIAACVFYFVYSFKGEALQFIDLYSIGTAFEVASGYEYVVGRWMAVFVTLALCLFAVVLHCSDRALCRKTIGKIVMRVVLIGVIIGGRFFYYETSWNTDLGITANLWDAHKTYQSVGTNMGFFVVAKFSKNDPPKGYNVNDLKEYAKESEELYESFENKPESVKTKPVNIIAIMNESWADYRHGNENFETNKEYMPYFDSMSENVIKGHIMVCISGGGTAKTEYEFLTGNSVKQYPGLVPYVNYFKHDQYSLVSMLKSQGYKAIAMHPENGRNWNRDTAYKYYGFDEFLTQDDFPEGVEKLRAMITDKADYEKVIEIVNSKENKDDPLFLFNVTMQNHGGYTSKSVKNDIRPVGCDDEGISKFLTLQKISDDALEYLIEYFKDFDEPTMIVMFGDHYPQMSDEFQEYIAGSKFDDLEDEEREKYYETPFFIWTNYESETEEDVIISSSFLGTLVMEKTGLKVSPFLHYEEMLMDKIKGYNHLGYYDASGNFTSWENASEDVKDLLSWFESIQYNALMEDKNRINWFFEISE